MRFVASLVALTLAGPLVAADSPFFFQKGDRIVFLGDSITEQYQYSTDIELYLTTRFPSWNLAFLNAGIGGDTAAGGAGRFQEHVLNEKPTAVTINFGMNDGGYGKFDAGRNKQYGEKTAAMLEMAKKAGVRVALVSPNAVDRRRSPQFSDFKVYLETQKQFYAPLKELAEKHGVTFVDQYAVTRAALERMEKDKADQVVPFGDGFHTASPGGLLMAHAILTGLGAPAQVSNVEILLPGGGAKRLEGFYTKCNLSDLKATDTAVSFTRLDDALPMPIQKDWVSLLPYVNDLKDLNYYGLTVRGLPNGKYTIAIDGTEVLTATADELAKGVNLGNVTTGPVWEQGQKVFNAINDKNKIVHGRFRGVILATIPDWLADVARERKPAELSKRKELIDAKQAEVYKLVQPQLRKFHVKRAEKQ
jgi:lysophospholipase L1-like esterase